eukprot:scaffold47068_cov63-Phaeocystis_antarctica.AAC.1
MPAETRAVHEVAKMLRAMPALETSTTVRTRLAGSWAVDGIIFKVGMDVYKRRAGASGAFPPPQGTSKLNFDRVACSPKLCNGS